jgi:translation initiation factor 6 (eIF-6)
MSKLEIETLSSESVLTRVNHQGLLFNTKVDLDIPEIPQDITELDDNGLMSLFSELTAYGNFVNAQLAIAMVDERESESDLELAESKAIIEAHSLKKELATVTKAKAALDPEVQKAKTRYKDKYAYRKIIEVMANNIEKNTQLISRELSRRIGGHAPNARGNRLFP